MPKVHLKIGEDELSIEGPESFLGQYESAIDTMLDRILSNNRDSEHNAPQDNVESVPSQKAANMEFGEALHHLPRSATGPDQILLAGLYAQRSNEKNTFKTSEANQLLIDQGIKLPNPSNSLSRNNKAKRVFKLGGEYRISSSGEDYLRTLMGSGDQEAG